MPLIYSLAALLLASGSFLSPGVDPPPAGENTSVNLFDLVDECGMALSGKDAEACKRLREAIASGEVDLEIRDQDGSTPLIHAGKGDHEEASRLLIEAGADVNAQDADGETALMAAAFNRDSKALMQMLLDAGSDIDTVDRRRETALVSALGSDDPDNIRFLLEAGAEVGVTVPRSDPFLNHVVRSRTSIHKEAIIRMLVELGADVDVAGRQGMTPLMWAARCCLEVAELLIELGADVSAEDRGGYTALMNAASSNEDPAMTEVLFRAGADPNARNGLGNTVLMAAAKNSNPEVTRAVLDLGVDVNAMTPGRLTALMCAAGINGESVNIPVLIEAGADVRISSLGGDRTALKFVAAYQKDRESLRLLLEAGADIDDVGGFGDTPLMFAAGVNKHIDMMMFLLEQEADPTIRRIKGLSALMLAARNRSEPERITILLEAGARCDARDDQGLTALMLAAAHSSNPEVAARLIGAGAEVNATCRNGRTPLMWAAAWEGVGFRDRPAAAAELVELLLAAGADPARRDDSGRTALQIARSNDRLKDGEVKARLEELLSTSNPG